MSVYRTIGPLVKLITSMDLESSDLGLHPGAMVGAHAQDCG